MATVAPDHTMRRTAVQWNSFEPSLLMYLSGPTGFVLAFHGLTGLAKAVCKSRPGYL